MKVSIITATFNSQETIKTTLESVKNQTYSNIEHIIIDGKSSDDTIKIISEYQHISQIISEKDNGIYFALNKGIEKATGDIIGFLHADDFFNDNKTIETIVSYFQNYKIEAIYGDLDYLSIDLKKTVRHWHSEDFNINKLDKGWMPPHPTFYVKKSIYDKYGRFNTKYKISADYDLMIRFLKNNITVKYIPQTIIKMRLGGESNKNLKNIYKKTKEDFEIIRKNQLNGLVTLFFKNISKVHQFFNKKNNN
jgi:glycosyltransferase